MKRALIPAVVAALVIGCTSTNLGSQAPSPSAAASAAASVSAPRSAVAPSSPSPSPSATVAPTATAAASPSVAAQSPGASGSTALDPCTILDPIKDLAALGGATTSPHPGDSTDFGPECDYPTPAGALQIVVFRPEVSDAVFESSNAKTEISALGDEAFYDSEWHRLRVRVGDNRFQISCFCVLPSGTEQDVLTTIAKLAAGNLS